ncbi:Pr6Pr family membrane protein [Dyella subtropica]|uniref:Pr6Pr family membrane protein n=1 Tax=Dyella subtropica TaxID=2992127 RepID=UPI002250D493|nr:Pr6Pr family membrane protein [Dyella subtropica]
MSTRYRWFAAFAAALGWFTLALKLLLSIRMTQAMGQGALAGVWLYLGFYTVLTNMLVALALTAGSTGPRGPITRFFGRPGVNTAIAMSIAVVGVIYSLLLRHLWNPQGWQLFADIMVHDAMPPIFLLYWWLAVPKWSLRWQHIVLWQAYPVGYFAYVLARGALIGRYPYPFLDVNTLGYARVVGNACLVLLAFVAVALVLVALARWQVRRATREVVQAA